MQATNTTDGKALHIGAIQSKQNYNYKNKTVLCCWQIKATTPVQSYSNVSRKIWITHVPYKEQPGVKHIANEFLAETFEYNTLTDTYTCPAAATLTLLGTWHNKKGEANETSYRFKTHCTDACKTCPLKNQCTKLPKRIIRRREYQDAVDINDNNIKQIP